MFDVIAQVTSLEEAAGAESLTLDSAILGEQFYFWTVVLMWLIHVGFMSYEAGVVRRKNVMATAMKNILTIAAVTPTFYYFGWWIYNCNQPGLPIGPNSSDFTAAACQGGIPWSDAFGPNLANNINLIFFLAFLLFSWTTASIMSGALLERVRLSAYLRARGAARLGRLDPRRRVGLERRRLDDAAVRLPRLDRVRRRPRRRRRIHARRAVQPRAADRQVHEGRPGEDLQTPQPAPDADGADAHLHGLLRVLRGVPRDRLDGVPGLGQHLPEPDDARLDHDDHHVRLRGRVHRRLTSPAAATRSGRSPAAWRASSACPRGPTSTRRCSATSSRCSRPCSRSYAGKWIERKMRVDDVVGAVAVHGVSGFLGVFWVGVFAAGYPTGVNNVDSSIGGQLHRRRDVPAARLPVGLRGLVGAAQAQPAARAGVGRARRPRRGRVLARHLRARVRAGARTCSSSPTERAGSVDEVQAAELLAIGNGRGSPDERVPV